MRSLVRGSFLTLPFLLAVAVAACGDDGGGADDDDDDDTADACVGIGCNQVACPNAGETTSLSGTVYMPNGTLPLYNATVYIPLDEVAPFTEGAQCDRCGSVLSGVPLVQTTTNTRGEFKLDNVPAGIPIPLVIQVGKWRRQVTIPAVEQCVDTPLAAGDTRLPRNQSEGDIPKMALTTGGADALECLLRKVGLDDSEFTTDAGSGRVHMFAGAGGADQFDAANGGAAFSNATTLWDDVASLSTYDVVFLSCEGDQNVGAKPAPSRQAMKDYADLGGRVFTSHWHNVWIEQGPAPWDTAMDWEFQDDLGNVTANVNRGFDRGADLADWLEFVGASPTNGAIDLTDTQHTLRGVEDGVDPWITLDTTTNGTPSVQYASFTTPLEAAGDQRCGRVVFSDIHISTGDDSTTDIEFPSEGCTTDIAVLTPQEKVLAFMIFDIASCVGPVVD